MYSAPSSELLELTQETIICTSGLTISGDGPFENELLWI